MKDQSDVGSLSCRVTFKPVSAPLQDDLRLLRHPIPTRSPASPYGPLSTFLVGTVGLTTFRTRTIHEGLSPDFPPAVQHLRGRIFGLPNLTAYLLVHAYQPLWHGYVYDGSTAVHLHWSYPSTLAPNCPEASSRNVPSRFGCPSTGRRLHCPERFAPRGFPRRTAR